MASIRSVGNLISIDHLRNGRLSQEGMDFFATSAAGMIASVTTNRDLQNVLAATSLLYGGIKNKSTFYEHAMINNSYMESAYRFTEGSMQVSLELIHIIRANGGTVLNRKEVTRILVKDEAIQGVEVNHEEVLESTYVISNLHPQLTLSLLDKNHSIKPAFVSRIKSLGKQLRDIHAQSDDRKKTVVLIKTIIYTCTAMRMYGMTKRHTKEISPVV